MKTKRMINENEKKELKNLITLKELLDERKKKENEINERLKNATSINELLKDKVA